MGCIGAVCLKLLNEMTMPMEPSEECVVIEFAGTIFQITRGSSDYLPDGEVSQAKKGESLLQLFLLNAGLEIPFW